MSQACHWTSLISSTESHLSTPIPKLVAQNLSHFRPQNNRNSKETWSQPKNSRKVIESKSSSHQIDVNGTTQTLRRFFGCAFALDASCCCVRCDIEIQAGIGCAVVQLVSVRICLHLYSAVRVLRSPIPNLADRLMDLEDCGRDRV